MNYTTVSSLKHKVEMALLDFKSKSQKCLSCGDEREAIPLRIGFAVSQEGEIVVELVGSIFTENDWKELYAEPNEDAPVIGAICRSCAIRKKLAKDPEEIPVAVPTTPAEVAVPTAAKPQDEEIPF